MRTPTRRARSAFTLVELLVTITIIGIVMSFAVAGMMAASGAARRDRTEAVITKLDSQIMIRWESYHTRRLPIVPATATAAGVNRTNAAVTRLNALRELMRLEMPTRYEDIAWDVAAFPALSITTSYLPGPPQLSLAYLRRYNGNTVNGVAAQPTEEFQAAECLYMIVTMGLEDVSEGSELIANSFIGDADGDGMPEFHDGWNNPIHFVRWPAGYFSDRQPAASGSSPLAHDPLKNHDPFDPLGVDPGAYALYPLISSAGPDEEHDIVVNNDADNPTPIATAQLEYNNPYDTYTDGSVTYSVGQAFDFADDGTVGNDDNITNHLLGSR